MQDLNDKITGGTLTAVEWNEVPSELQNLITGTNQGLSSGDLFQVAKAVSQYVSDGNFFVAGGTVDAITLSKSGLSNKQVPIEQTEGQKLRFQATGNNTGNVTVTPFGLANKKILDRFDNELPADSILAGQLVEIQFVGALDGGGGAYALSVIEVPFAKGYLNGLTLSNGTDTVNDIDIDIGLTRDSTNNINMVFGSILTKQIDVDWAPGTAAGGFPTGLTLTNDTFYRVFAIVKPDGTTDGGYDTSSTAANLLADASTYTQFRQIGWILYGTGTIVQFIQTGNDFRFIDPITDINNQTSSTGGSLFTITCPTLLKAILTAAVRSSSSSDQYFKVSQVDQADNAASIADYDCFGRQNTDAANEISRYVSASSQLRERSTTTNIKFYIRTHGWFDPRGQE